MAARIVALKGRKPQASRRPVSRQDLLEALADASVRAEQMRQELTLVRAAFVGLCREVADCEVPPEDVADFLDPIEHKLHLLVGEAADITMTAHRVIVGAEATA